MSDCTDFSEISVLIPGYSVEDLPTDLQEDDASSLLNAIACAWHPDLLRHSSSIPLFRQAESLTGYPGRRIVLVPKPSESWMPHEWRTTLRDQGHVVIDGCSSREDWLNAIAAALSDETLRSLARSGPSACANEVISSSADAGAPPTAVPETSAAVSTDPVQKNSSAQMGPSDPGTANPILVDHFLSLGTVLMQLQLLSRRRHHHVDPDSILLSREVHLAADAAAAGDEATARTHLARCFEHLRDTREKFYPLNSYLIDVCIPGDDEDPAQIRTLLASKTRLNLFATGRDLIRWLAHDESLTAALKEAVSCGQLNLLTGHDAEIRPSLSSLAAVAADIERCRTIVTQIIGVPPRHWARRRYGLTASMPTLLAYFGFESALHVALDDGLYPDRERSQFEWQAPDGSLVAAASRIPLAIDSASGFLKFADRYNESMQDDTTAALFLARLPTLKTPWLADLQIAASYSPVLGEFATMDTLCRVSEGSRLAEKHLHSEYLSPFLIQSSVLKTEPPISGPATLRALQQRCESARTLLALAGLIRSVGCVSDISGRLRQLDTDVASLELQHVDTETAMPAKAMTLAESASAISSALDDCESQIINALQSRIAQQASTKRGLLVTNSIPFSRLVEVTWPESWQRPAADSVIEAAQRVDSRERMLVKLPPGGFAWLTECSPDQSAQALLEKERREPPLAESLTLRNRHFEVTLSDRTGGVSSVTFHQQRGNRLSQQACFRYEREQTLPDDGSGEIRKVSYAELRLGSHQVLDAGPVFAAIETTAELVSPLDQSVLAIVRQVTSLDRIQPRIQISLTIEQIANSVKGNPWLTYFGSRFAWDNEAAAITRSVMGHAAGFRSERFESPDYVEISDTDHRVVIATHGRPYHRRSGPRMLDSLMIVEGESERAFHFTIDFDQPFPLRTSTEALTPPVIRETSGCVPTSMPSGWILGLSARNVELVRADFHSATVDHSEELSLLVTETEGVYVRCLIKTARCPSAAFAVNAERSGKITLDVSDQGVVIPLNPFQLKEVLLVF